MSSLRRPELYGSPDRQDEAEMVRVLHDAGKNGGDDMTISTTETIKVKGWAPVINGQVHPELFDNRQDAIAKAEQIYELSAFHHIEIDAVYVINDIPLAEIKKYTDL